MKSLLKRAARNWWIKVLSQKLIGLIPGRLGSSINLALARLLQGNITERPTAGAYRIHRSMRNIRLMREHSGFVISGCDILEIGTGWRGGDPLLFLICGARAVTTVDHAKWLTMESLRHSIEVIGQVWDDIRVEVSCHVDDGPQRLERIREVSTANNSLEFILQALNINYFIRHDADPTALGLPPQSVDLFYSESVLQRIPEAKLENYVRVVCGYLLKPDGAIFHRTDQRDIHTLQHVGNKDWALAYLRFPDWIFHCFLNGRFISQNRLRESDFIDIFTSKGIGLQYIESRRHNEDLERVKTTRFAGRFRAKTPEDMATRCSILIGRKDRKSHTVVKEVCVGGYDEIEA